ncbi:inorganic diphosphatase [Streptomyces caniscabiei]|uniref:inorganic diphosphatase n=1 Tax=Streptomyces caniscabiei TaxID=2746961 RepID=UPI0029B12283|nr:inorganic diphosphatase [Streptomyces caniscabiei]MDX2775984.1 inorganic diphosphatase [Streptomyces caniscabiei]
MNQLTPTKARDYIGKTVTVTMDRQLGTKHPKHGFEYPVNYGFIKGTISGDGEELDAYVLDVTEPLESFTGICVAIIHRTNDDDDKLVLITDDTSITDDEIRTQTHFQEQWFESVIIRE